MAAALSTPVKTHFSGIEAPEEGTSVNVPVLIIILIFLLLIFVWNS